MVHSVFFSYDLSFVLWKEMVKEMFVYVWLFCCMYVNCELNQVYSYENTEDDCILHRIIMIQQEYVLHQNFMSVLNMCAIISHACKTQKQTSWHIWFN